MQRLLILLIPVLLWACKQDVQGKQKQAIKNIEKTNMISFDTITLGGGCFWCIEAVFQRLEGVKSVRSGYAGGKIKNPTYREVCSGLTGHAEVVEVVYDPAVVSYRDILKVFFTVHDPTTLNRQGADQGTQYRSVIFYHKEAQKMEAEDLIRALNAEGAWADPVVTELSPATVFYPAEDYHQNYYNDNPNQPYCRFVVGPKVEKFEKVFSDRLRKP
jgi:peptide-methionine (S)-S-oxide reductase